MYVAALYERMRADQRKFGKSAWAAAVERMERLQYAVSKETLQLMRAKEICLEQRKHGLKEEVKHTTTHWFITDVDHVCILTKLLILDEFVRSHNNKSERLKHLHSFREKGGKKSQIIAALEKWPHGSDILQWSE